MIVTLFRMEFFWSTHGSEGGGKKTTLLKIYHTYLTMIKLGTVIPNRKKIQKI